jgi:hypothetical protein
VVGLVVWGCRPHEEENVDDEEAVEEGAVETLLWEPTPTSRSCSFPLP